MFRSGLALPPLVAVIAALVLTACETGQAVPPIYRGPVPTITATSIPSKSVGP